MRTTRPPVADGLSLAPRAASSATSTSTTAMIQGSYATAPDFLNSLLGTGKSCSRQAGRRYRAGGACIRSLQRSCASHSSSWPC